MSDEGKSQGRGCSLTGLRGVSETCCPLALRQTISSSWVMLRNGSTKSPNNVEHIKNVELLESQLNVGCFSVAEARTQGFLMDLFNKFLT